MRIFAESMIVTRNYYIYSGLYSYVKYYNKILNK